MRTTGVIRLLAGLVLAGCTMYVPVARVRPMRPPGMVVEEPRLAVIAGLDIWYCPELDDDVFFYDNLWFVYRPGGWYYCRRYGDPWIFLQQGRLPERFIRIPPEDFKHVYGRYHPAHDHHPDQDHWVIEDERGRGREGNRGRGNGWGRGRDD